MDQKVAVMRNIEKLLGEALGDPDEVQHPLDSRCFLTESYETKTRIRKEEDRQDRLSTGFCESCNKF